MLERVDENTIFVVPTLGVTYTGMYEPVQEIADALDQLQADTGLDVDIHVDAASGGLPRAVLRARPGVGLPAAAGEVDQHVGSQVRARAARRRLGHLARRRRAARRPDLPRELPRRRHAGVPDQLLPPGRPGRRAVLRLPPARPRRLPDESTTPATRPGRMLAEVDPELGPFELLCDSNPATGIPTVTWRINEGEDPGYTLFDLADRLRITGWQVPAYTLTGDRVRHPRAAHPRAPGREPGPGVDPAATTCADADRPLRQAPGHRADDRGGVQRLQPPVTAAAPMAPSGMVDRHAVHHRLGLLRPGRVPAVFELGRGARPTASPTSSARCSSPRPPPCSSAVRRPRAAWWAGLVQLVGTLFFNRRTSRR